ncbi:uncharacterized protein LTHEOB_11042 [Lasiodiplodia theobromae]|uniref:uncharacterized protein n=1 Tax=Lasiodiplodia theobromae TaxID=45133 RepID=UPI0015C30252|nr:uncharacterized protein LTHEOB_11042 [Lasiodiplodia theobromae]KAF4538094.1 hypothetical protein LTHEOB_11042 [Lasiodiplodia theobromae]
MALLASVTSTGARLWRSKHVLLTSPSRTLSIFCRGKPISREDVFKFTGGRFLVKEKEACDQRYLKFDLDQLCAVVASTGSKSPVRTIEKEESGYCKVLLMTKEDGSELVAKLPFSYAGPPKYMTASEAAVMQYVHDHTEVPVPKLLTWSADASNPVGAEYVIMEKAAGCRLSKKWAEMDLEIKFKFIANLAELEAKLAGVDFPAYGSLYLKESLDDGEQYEPLAPEIDPDGRFCIGPSCEREWFHEEDTEAIEARFDRGPWLTLPAFGNAVADREIARIELNPKPDVPYGPPRGSIEEQLHVLEMAKTLYSRSDPDPHSGNLAFQTLWHPDLHMGNIYVSDEDPTKISSIIDWQYCVVAPLFCQARFPALLEVDYDDYKYGSEIPKPQFPENFHELDEDDQNAARSKAEMQILAKVYEKFSGYDMKRALRVPWFFPSLFNRCGSTWQRGAVPLRPCLIRTAQYWTEMGWAGDCPLKFSEDYLEKSKKEVEEYQAYIDTRRGIMKLMHTTSEGWFPPDVDFEAVQKMTKELREKFIEFGIKEGVSLEEIQATWPF